MGSSKPYITLSAGQVWSDCIYEHFLDVREWADGRWEAEQEGCLSSELGELQPGPELCSRSVNEGKDGLQKYLKVGL